jgi:hypothetical protein
MDAALYDILCIVHWEWLGGARCLITWADLRY